MTLYHGSKYKKLEILEPKRISYRDENEGPVIFATPDIQYAHCFLVNQSGIWPLINKWNNENWTVVFRGKIVEIQKIDVGGAIYTLDSSDFSFQRDSPSAEYEWTSKTIAKPIGKVLIDSAIESMLESNINMYFAEKELQEKLTQSQDYGYEILKKLKPYCKSLYS